MLRGSPDQGQGAFTADGFSVNINGIQDPHIYTGILVYSSYPAIPSFTPGGGGKYPFTIAVINTEFLQADPTINQGADYIVFPVIVRGKPGGHIQVIILDHRDFYRI